MMIHAITIGSAADLSYSDAIVAFAARIVHVRSHLQRLLLAGLPSKQ